MILALFVSFSMVLAADGRVDLEPLGRFDPGQIPEASGVVKSRRHSDVFWVHNDSGNLPVLYAITRDARILGAHRIAAANLDWEDIAVDRRGRLYIGDIGSNKGILGLRVIHRIDEPEPNKPARYFRRPDASSWYSMPIGERFDAESLVYDDEAQRAIVITKRFDGLEAELREVPFNPPAPFAKPAKPKLLGSLPGFVEPATGADLSADGRLLVVCGNRVVRVYHRPDLKAWDNLELIAEVKIRQKQQVEGIAWDGFDLILVSEGKGVDRIAEEVWKQR